MTRYCFLLQVRPELLVEYRRRHQAVWPEMLAALRRSGWRNYSLFARADGLLVGYVEATDLVAAQQAMAATEVNQRWQAEMSGFFTGLDGRGPDEGFELLSEVFNLDEQWAAVTNTTINAADASRGGDPPGNKQPVITGPFFDGTSDPDR